MHPTGQSHFSFLAGRPALVIALVAGFLIHAALPPPTQEHVKPFVAGGLPVVLVMLLLVEIGSAWHRRRNRRLQSGLMEELRAANSRLSLRVVELSRRREDLELLESAVVHANDAVVILDPEPQPGTGRHVRYVNDAFCRMSGYSRAEIIGRSLHVLRGPMSDDASLGRIREALDAGAPLQTEIVNHRKDGTPYWTDLSLVPVPAEEGGIAHWVMIQRDVTDRKQMEQALRESEEKLRVLGDSLPSGAIYQLQFEADGSRRFTYASAGIEPLLGVTREELLADAQAVYCVIHPEDLPALAETEERATSQLTPFDHELRTLQRDGTVKWLHIRARAVPRPGGGSTWNGVIMDVTDRRRLKEQLIEAQKLEAVGMLAGGIAHDFNNLLTGVLGNLSLVQLPGDDPNQPRLAAVEEAAERAAELTMKLLSFARRNQLVTGPVAPEVALAEVAGSVQQKADPRVTVKVEVAPGCGPVLADAGLLHRALVALSRNALDAMPAGGTLTLSAEPVRVPPGRAAKSQPSTFIRLSVADTGVGMTEDLKTKIFDPFFSTKGTRQGAGLGLGMVGGIVNQHHGWLECTSTPGAGTRIDLYLPPHAERAEVEAGQDCETPPPPSSRPEESPGSENTILLVDDEPMIREVGRTVLEREGYCVMTACDGLEAVDIFEREWQRVSLVILDVTMPRMSGREAYHHLTRIHPDVRILFSTGYSADDIAELDGALGLLNKPYRPGELLQAVREALTVTPVGQ